MAQVFQSECLQPLCLVKRTLPGIAYCAIRYCLFKNPLPLNTAMDICFKIEVFFYIKELYALLFKGKLAMYSTKPGCNAPIADTRHGLFNRGRT